MMAITIIVGRRNGVQVSARHAAVAAGLGPEQTLKIERRSSAMMIRQATREDLPCILAVYSALDVDHSAVLSEDKANDIFDKILTYPNYRIYVAVADNDIVGAFALAVMDNLAHMGMPSGLIEDVAVKTEWQGKGIGKQMMLFALERCRESGCYKLALSSNIKRIDAHHFYESLGFEKHGYSFLIDL